VSESTSRNAAEKAAAGVLSLNDKGCSRAGGKAAGLQRLIAAGMTVPSGFILTGDPSEDDRKLILKEWEKLGKPAVAVRSSASDEDSGSWSAAGQYETFLDIRTAEVLVQAVHDCTGSLHNRRADHYRQDHSSGGIRPVMNVIVQEMVDARFAGVFFSRNPLSRRNDTMVLEAVCGGGEQLVDGSLAAVRYTLSRQGEILGTENPGDTEELPVEFIRQLVREAAWFCRLEDSPLDMEWAADRDMNLYWLQARPVTTAETPAIDEFDYRVKSDQEILTRSNIGEMIPGAVTPVTREVFGESIEYAMRRLYGSVGAIHRGNRDDRFVVSFSNHMIFNFSTIYCMVDRVLGASKEGIEMSILGRTIADPVPHKPAPKIIQFINLFRYIFTMGSHKRFLKKLVKLEKDLTFSGSREPEECFREWVRLIPVMNEAYALHMLVSGNSGFANTLLTRMLERFFPGLEVNDSLLSHLLSGVEEVESAQAVRALEEISRAIRDREGFTLLFLRLKDREAETLLRENRDTPGELYRTFLERHGHRCIREAEFRSRGWEEEPEVIIRNIRELLRKPESPGAASAGIRRFPIDDFLKEIPGGSGRRAVKWALNQSRNAVRERELSKSLSIRVHHRFKKELRYIAALLKKQNRLPDEDLIYFLTQSEMRDLIYRGETGGIGKARIRRRLLPRQEENQPPEFWRGIPPTVRPKTESAGSPVLKGTPVSTGRVSGKVRIIRTPGDAEKLRPGEIMVAPLTDIGWTPYYSIAGGMITEIGSALSHGSVIAREYGLPLVTNINGATGKLREGTLVELDGEEGTVRILEAG